MIGCKTVWVSFQLDYTKVQGAIIVTLTSSLAFALVWAWTWALTWALTWACTRLKIVCQSISSDGQGHVRAAILYADRSCYVPCNQQKQDLDITFPFSVAVLTLHQFPGLTLFSTNAQTGKTPHPRESH